MINKIDGRNEWDSDTKGMIANYYILNMVFRDTHLNLRHEDAYKGS